MVRAAASANYCKRLTLFWHQNPGVPAWFAAAQPPDGFEYLPPQPLQRLEGDPCNVMQSRVQKPSPLDGGKIFI